MIMIVLQCNDLYFKWLELLLESLTAQGVEYPVVVSIYGGSEDMQQRCLDIYPNITVELDLDNQYQLPLDQFSLRDCITSRKIFVLADVVDRFDPDWVLMLDVDTLCRRPFMPWIQELLNNKKTALARTG